MLHTPLNTLPARSKPGLAQVAKVHLGDLKVVPSFLKTSCRSACSLRLAYTLATACGKTIARRGLTSLLFLGLALFRLGQQLGQMIPTLVK